MRKHKKAMAVKKAAKKLAEAPSSCCQSPRNGNHSDSPNNVLATAANSDQAPNEQPVCLATFVLLFFFCFPHHLSLDLNCFRILIRVFQALINSLV